MIIRVFFPFYNKKKDETLLDIASHLKIFIAQVFLLLLGDSVYSILHGRYLPVSGIMFSVATIILYPVFMSIRLAVKKELKETLISLLNDRTYAEEIYRKATDIAYLNIVGRTRISGNTLFSIIVVGGITISIYISSLVGECLNSYDALSVLLCTFFSSHVLNVCKAHSMICVLALVPWFIGILMYMYIYMYAVSGIPYIFSLFYVVNKFRNIEISHLKIGQLFSNIYTNPLDARNYELEALLDFSERISILYKYLVKLSVALITVTLLTIAWHMFMRSFSNIIIAAAIIFVSIVILSFTIYSMSIIVVDVREKARKAIRIIKFNSIREAHVQGLEDVPRPILRLISIIEENVNQIRTFPLSISDIIDVVQIIGIVLGVLVQLVITR